MNYYNGWKRMTLNKQRLSEMADCWATAHVPLFASDMKADFQKHFGTLIDPAIPSEKIIG